MVPHILTIFLKDFIYLFIYLFIYSIIYLFTTNSFQMYKQKCQYNNPIKIIHVYTPKNVALTSLMLINVSLN